MSTEATASAPAPTVTTATEATATVPGTDLPAHPDAPGKIDLKQFFADRYASQHAVKRGAAPSDPAPKAVAAAAPAPASIQTAPAEEAPKPPAVAPAIEEKPKEEPEKPTAEEDEIAARLKRLAAASESAARERKMRERERAASAKVKEAETAHAKEIALARKIEEARTKGSKVAMLEAMGYSKQEIANSGWVVDLLNELGDQEAPAPLTAADVDRMLAEKLKAEEEAKKLAEEKAKAEREASLLEAKASFFSQVKVEFKSGSYPALRADGATQGQLDAFYQAHLARNPGQYWTAKELLDRAEAHTVAFYEAQEKKIADLKAKLKPATPAAKAPAVVPTRTVTQSTVADAGPVVIEPPKKLDIKEKQRKARDEFAAKFAPRAR